MTLLATVPPVYPSRRLCLLLCDLELPLLQLVHDCNLGELDLVGDILVLGLLEFLLLVDLTVNSRSSVSCAPRSDVLGGKSGIRAPSAAGEVLCTSTSGS